MREALLRLLRAPRTGEPLTLHTFESVTTSSDGEKDVIEGILTSRDSREAFPIIRGIPAMRAAEFPKEFLDKHGERISQELTLSKLNFRTQKSSEWSFSAEWEQHFKDDLERTWGWTLDERVQQFHLETSMEAEACRGKLILDAGCGNGQLTDRLGQLGATVIGIDYSASVFQAEQHRKSPNVHFVQGDLQAPPFGVDTFDLIISNGVLHHTPSTYVTFREVAKLVKAGGRFYLWLYRKPGSFIKRHVRNPAFDTVRWFVARMPHGPQALAVRFFAMGMLVRHKIQGRHKGEYSWEERIVGAYDFLTPMWRHYHTPAEVDCWFFESGYSPATLTHWDNPGGFGMVAAKVPQQDTPGPNFAKKEISTRFWK